MGQLKPGATYVYERDGKVTYAREIGADPSTRVAIGWDYDKDNPEFSKWLSEFANNYFWHDVLEVAKTNKALQEALERVKVLYYLSKENGNSKT